MRRGRVAQLAVVVTGLCCPVIAHAWIFEEHSLIARASAPLLTPTARLALDGVWTQMLVDPAAKKRLCMGPFRVTKADAKDCIDLGTLTAIAADHACHPDQMWSTVLTSDWIVDVVNAGQDTEAGIIEAGTSRTRTIDLWHEGHIDLQRRDSEYLSRAASNDAHFLTMRKSVRTAPATNAPLRSESFDEYTARIARDGTASNALASYLTYHAIALSVAARIAKGGLDPASASTLSRQMLLTESFALHFLQDSFSAGHLVGTSGGLALRKGTHDTYCENGYDAHTWDHQSYAAHGDAFLAQADMDHTANAVSESLQQVLDVSAGLSDDPTLSAIDGSTLTLDSCTATHLTNASAVVLARALTSPSVRHLLGRTVQPALEDALPPRSLAEVGVFLNTRLGVRGAGQVGGYLGPGSEVRAQGSTEIAVGLGIALEGLVTSTTDGLIFAQGRLTSHSAETDDFVGGNVTRVQQRFGWGFRVRMPFAILPGDAVYLGIPFYVFGGSLWPLVQAAKGHVFRFESVITTGIGELQVVLGREFAVTRLGETTSSIGVLAGGSAIVPAIKSTEYEIPVFEYRSKHIFANQLGGNAVLQVGAAIDVPFDTQHRVSIPNAYSGFLRIAIDGRYFFVKK